MQTMSILGFIWQASFLVKLVVFALIIMSIISWSIIIYRSLAISNSYRVLNRFNKRFWAAKTMQIYYEEIANQKQHQGIEAIFKSGYDVLVEEKFNQADQALIEFTDRCMTLAKDKVNKPLEEYLPILATISATSPYIGLFGTVCGIVNTFHALGLSSDQVSLSVVAPGISEALVTTGLGLFVAIPAVIGYNRLTQRIASLDQNYEVFREEFIQIIYRQLRSQ